MVIVVHRSGPFTTVDCTCPCHRPERPMPSIWRSSGTAACPHCLPLPVGTGGLPRLTIW